MKKPKARPDTPISTLLHPETNERLDRFCQDSGLKKKHVIGLAIKKFLDRQEPKEK